MYFTKTIGSIIFCMPTAILGLLFYHYFQNDKVTFLRLNKGDIDAPTKITHAGKQELELWLENIYSIQNPIALFSIDLEYFLQFVFIFLGSKI